MHKRPRQIAHFADYQAVNENALFGTKFEAIPPMQKFIAYLLLLAAILLPGTAAAQDVVTGEDIVAYARTFKGTPYKLGAMGPKAFDCSSYTRYVYKHFGYDLTAYSAVQLREGRPVNSYRELQKGDLVFFGKRAGVRAIGHVGIVVSVDREKGSFTFIHASVSQGVVEQTSSHPYFMMRYIGARRILPDE